MLCMSSRICSGRIGMPKRTPTWRRAHRNIERRRCFAVTGTPPDTRGKRAWLETKLGGGRRAECERGRVEDGRDAGRGRFEKRPLGNRREQLGQEDQLGAESARAQ